MQALFICALFIGGGAGLPPVGVLASLGGVASAICDENSALQRKRLFQAVLSHAKRPLGVIICDVSPAGACGIPPWTYPVVTQNLDCAITY
jgi:hypothetical protein